MDIDEGKALRDEANEAKELADAFEVLVRTEGWGLFTKMLLNQIRTREVQVVYGDEEQPLLRGEARGLKLALSLVPDSLAWAEELLNPEGDNEDG